MAQKRGKWNLNMANNVWEFGPWKRLQRKGKSRRQMKKQMERERKKERKNWLDSGSMPMSRFRWGFGKEAGAARRKARDEARKLRRKKR
jgi:hypothetical protein